MLNLSRALQLVKIKDLRRRVLIVVSILIAFRILANIPIPGINHEALEQFFASNQILGLLNVFSGGTLSNLSIAMLGLGPHITAIIIMQLLTMVSPRLKIMYYEEGAIGRAKFNRYSRFLTVPLAAFQGYGFLRLLASQNVLPRLGPVETITNILIVIAGSMILVWLGELITEQKMGNGISFLIFAGIVSGFPLIVRNAALSYSQSQLPTYLSFIALAFVVIIGIVLIHEGERKVPVSYAKRVRGNKMYGGVSTYLPLRVGQAGVIPIIFALSLLLLPQFFGQIAAAFSPNIGNAVTGLASRFLGNQLLYGVSYFFLVFIFTFFYTNVTFNPEEISKNLQRAGGFVPGIRPGNPTSAFLKRIVTRITFFGGLFLGLIAVLPLATQALTQTQVLTIGGTSILIVVSVALETAKQIDSELTVREYEV
ncbi:MAG: preprotein translocase subunit SecY [Candidatus Colwellbacteria bacterium]|nr:preprotein translocase subunit SecY [Candidatus Colwellbacteria bacterium]